VTLIYSFIAIGGGLLLFKLLYKRSFRQIGLISHGSAAGMLHGMAIGIVSMSLVFGCLLLFGQAETTVDVKKLLSATILINFASVGLTAFSEELLARGIIMTALKATRRRYVILCASSLIFSLVHLLNPGATVLSLINTFLAGLFFAYMFMKSGALWLPTGFHLAWNFLQGDVFGMNVSGREQFAVFYTKMGTNKLLTGGNTGPEGGLLVTCALILGFAYVRFVIKAPNYPHWSLGGDLPLTREKNDLGGYSE
jgi:membrane protease YdiL (CAAX protease family)